MSGVFVQSDVHCMSACMKDRGGKRDNYSQQESATEVAFNLGQRSHLPYYGQFKFYAEREREILVGAASGCGL